MATGISGKRAGGGTGDGGCAHRSKKSGRSVKRASAECRAIVMAAASTESAPAEEEDDEDEDDEDADADEAAEDKASAFTAALARC